MTKSAQSTILPDQLADVAHVSAKTCAAAGGVSISHWHAMVLSGVAPQPVIRAPRCTRWRMSDVRRWLIERAERGSDAATAARVIRLAHKASAAAKATRKAAP